MHCASCTDPLTRNQGSVNIRKRTRIDTDRLDDHGWWEVVGAAIGRIRAIASADADGAVALIRNTL